MALPPLPKRIEHALKVLVCLAQHDKQPIRAREIARCVRIPPAQAAKILYLLTWAGFVRSRRGSKGGFWLARPPERIRVKQVMQSFQAPLNKGGGVKADPLMRVWETIAVSLDQSLDKLTLADLLRRTAETQGARPYVCPHAEEPVSDLAHQCTKLETEGERT